MNLKALLENKNLTMLILVSLVVFIILVGILVYNPQQNYSPKDDNFFNSQFNNEEKPSGLRSCPAKFECCMGTWYTKNDCEEGTCVKFKCELAECEFECCNKQGVEKKSCSSEKICENNECVTPSCPFECCTVFDNYSPKACNADYKCENNKCVQEECRKECCVDEPKVKEKPCENNLECINGVCQKAECPTMCCPARDPLYQEKKCLPHQICVGRICAPRI